MVRKKKHTNVSLLHYIDIALFPDKIELTIFLQMKIIPVWQGGVSISLVSRDTPGSWRISRILARGTRSSGSLLLPPPFAFYNGYDLYACLKFRDSALQIKMYYHFEGVFEIDESHRSISICPRHQDAFGIRLHCQNRFCAVPQSLAPNRAK